MSTAGTLRTAGSLATLGQLRRPIGLSGAGREPVPGAAGTPGARTERCELCGEPIAGPHGHVVDVGQRALLCACRACHLLFENPGAGAGQRRAVPERYRTVPHLVLPLERWESFDIPVSTAFFFHNSDHQRVVAFFPSPAGATECLLPIHAWGDLVADNPVLRTLAPDVEAALVRVGPPARSDPAPGTALDGAECFLVPITACYELVGVLRGSWHGIDGGDEARAAVDGFFQELRARAQTGPGGLP